MFSVNGGKKQNKSILSQKIWRQLHEQDPSVYIEKQILDVANHIWFIFIVANHNW